MLHEYPEVLEAVAAILDTLKDIASGSSNDTVDLSTIENDADNLANFVFGGDKEYIPATMVSSREAWDFVSAQKRLVEINSLERSDIYANAAEEFPADKKRIQYYDAVLKSLDRVGGQ